jgi:hypothetical protein
MSQPTRDSNGRFSVGNVGGPGRKTREIEREYLATMETIVSGEAWQAIVQRATQDAIGGDAKARSFIASYLLGQPVTRTEEPEQGDRVAEAIEQWRQAKLTMAQELGLQPEE